MTYNSGGDGYKDPSAGRIVTEPTPEMIADYLEQHRSANPANPDEAKRRVIGEYIAWMSGSTLLWQITHPDGVPDNLAGQYTSAMEAEKAIIKYKSKKGLKR